MSFICLVTDHVCRLPEAVAMAYEGGRKCGRLDRCDSGVFMADLIGRECSLPWAGAANSTPLRIIIARTGGGSAVPAGKRSSGSTRADLTTRDGWAAALEAGANS